MMTCGNCFHHRGGGRCKNKDASTYNSFFDTSSQGCQMHLTKLLLPFGFGVNILLAIIYVPLQIILMIVGGGSGSSSNSGGGGFNL